jgi:Esterase-like activity of phytase
MKSLVRGVTLSLFMGFAAFAENLPTADVLDKIAMPVESVDGTNIKELSGLGWDEDEKLLYAVSDNGYLHHFKITITDEKFGTVEPLFSVKIVDAASGFFGWGMTNAEGLHVRNGANGKKGDAELLIAFEDGPTMGRFTAQGKDIAEIKLPELLANPDTYRNSNKRLESVTELEPFGILTAPEAHIENDAKDIHSIFAMDGRRWSFPALQSKQDSVKALEALPDGRILVLVRTRDPVSDEPQAHLQIVDMSHCGEAVICPVTEVTVSNPKLLANDFEGMTRIGEGLFLIVTDSRHGGEMLLFRLKL